MKYAYALAAPLALACSPANAATVVEGFFNGGFFEQSIPLDLNRSGRYLITTSFGNPITDLFLRVEGQEVYHIFSATPPFRELGGNEVDITTDFRARGPLRTATFEFILPRDYTERDRFEIREGYYEITDVFLEFRSSGGTDYRVSANYIGAVPEPGTWALMILGFCATGFAMRRRVRATVSYS